MESARRASPHGLQLVVDDPDGRRLVLRDAGVGALEVLRRVLASVVAVGPLALAALAHVWLVLPWWHALWTVPVSLAWAVSVVRAARPLLAELGVDGRTGRVWMVERGYLLWGRRTRTRRVGQDLGLAFQGGFLVDARGGLGVAVELGPGVVSPVFAVAGLSRRDTLRALVDRVAWLLDLRVVVQRDDVDRVRFFCGEHGTAPSPADEGGGTYRELGHGPLSLSGAPRFEPVTTPPPPRSAAALARVVEPTEVRDDGSLQIGHAGDALTLREHVSRWGAAWLAWCLGQPWHGSLVVPRRPLGLTLGAAGLVAQEAGATRPLDVQQVVLVMHTLGPELATLTASVQAEGRWFHVVETRPERPTGVAALAVRRVAYDIAERCGAPLRTLQRP